jgi:hypothetical protein
LQEALVLAVRVEYEHAATAGAFRTELIAPWNTLALAGSEEQERTVAGSAMLSEFTALRGTLALAEGEMRERVSGAVALRVEVAALQGALTAARQAGKTAIAPLRLGNATPTKIEGPRGRRHAIVRFFGGWSELLNRAS